MKMFAFFTILVEKHIKTEYWKFSVLQTLTAMEATLKNKSNYYKMRKYRTWYENFKNEFIGNDKENSTFELFINQML